VPRRNPDGCEETGAYPAVDPVTGAVYVGDEFNWFTNAQPGPCHRQPTLNILAKIPLRCLPLAPVSPMPPASRDRGSPGEVHGRLIAPNNGRLNDFPRVAVSVPADTVSLAWNDSRNHRLGDILLRSFSLGALTPVQHRPVVLNKPAGGLHIYPAVRTVLWPNTPYGGVIVAAMESASGVTMSASEVAGGSARRRSRPGSWGAHTSISGLSRAANCHKAGGAPSAWGVMTSRSGAPRLALRQTNQLSGQTGTRQGPTGSTGARAAAGA
jgi:hypothetical protein